MPCKTGLDDESTAVLEAIPNPDFMLNWNPGRAPAIRQHANPNRYDLLPKNQHWPLPLQGPH